MALQAFPGHGQYQTERSDGPVASGIPSSEQPLLGNAQGSLAEHNSSQQLSQHGSGTIGVQPQYFRTVQTGALSVEWRGQDLGL